MRRVALLLLLVASCAPASWTQLPEAEQQRFSRCSNAVIAAQCGGGEAGYRAICGQDLAVRYSEEESERARQRWLIRHGCPPPMVE